jgi:hypothetical protein
VDTFFGVNLSQITNKKDLSLGEYLLLQNKCLIQIKGNNKKQEVAEQVRREEANESIDNMHYINTTEVAQSILTLTEAL